MMWIKKMWIKIQLFSYQNELYGFENHIPNYQKHLTFDERLDRMEYLRKKIKELKNKI